MSRAKHVSFEEFSGNLAQYLSRVRSDKVSLVVEYDGGERVLIKPYPPARQAIARPRQPVADAGRELEESVENISSVGAVFDLDPDSITPG